MSSSYLTDISMETPVGVLRMLTHVQNGTEYVVAAGFSDAADLQARLEAPLRNLHVKNGTDDHPYLRRIKQYFGGELSALDTIAYAQDGSLFSQDIWKALRAIPAGTTISYAELAHNAGKDTAVRAAGTACGKNHIMLLVPCHRVIKSNGGLGNYLYGSDIKARLLEHEAKYINRS